MGQPDEDLRADLIRVRSHPTLFAPSCLLAAVLLCVACADGEPKAVAEAGRATSPDQAPASQWFTEITSEAGLDFVHQAGPIDEFHLPAISAGGAAFLDFDNDGDLDIYLTNGNHILPEARVAAGPTNRLYRREADGRYTDVTEESGLGDPGYGMGVAVGDVDNDGHVDLFVTNYGPDRLYRNRGNGSFVDITSAAGVQVDGMSASAGFFDFDRDGLLDLYVTRYVDYRPAKRCSGRDGRPDFCGPKSFRPLHDVLLHNDGPSADGSVRFSDVSEAAGIASTFAAGLGLVFLDVNGDGWQDVYVANDGDPNQLWINQAPARQAPSPSATTR